MNDPAPLVTAATCGRMLGRLPCDNPNLHKGGGLGCTHDAGSGIPHQDGDAE